MKPAKFLENKIKRQLSCNGIEYTFIRRGEDAYHQPTEEKPQIKITGIYHEKNSYISESGADSSKITSKPVPMILGLWSEISQIKNGDIVFIGSFEYQVTGVSNIQNYNIAGDISLELKQ